MSSSESNPWLSQDAHDRLQAELDELIAARPAVAAEINARREEGDLRENGGYPHPDHIMCHKVSVAAFDAAGDPGRHPELGEPWQPLKLYYNSGWTRARMLALHEGMLAQGLESPYAEWLEKWGDRDDRGDKITTRIECGEYFEVRDDALRAHATQVDPDGFWFHVPMELQRKVWPTEDFELARSLVDSPVPESDLFAGVRESVQTH